MNRHLLSVGQVGAHRQRGAALLMAMVIVTLVATLAASMVWQQWRAVQVEGAERVRTQASWVLSGALDWARLILKEDARSGGSDDLTEVWAMPLAEARLSTFLASDSDNNSRDNEDDSPEAFLSGKVDDAQSKYNLMRLVGGNGVVDPNELPVFQRLMQFLGLSPSLADVLADSLSKAMLAELSYTTGDPAVLAQVGGEAGRAKASLVPQSVDQLLWLGGLDAGTLEKLRPYVTLLPNTGTLVNVNTASKEVIAAVVPGLDLARAARIVQARQRTPFKDKAELYNTIGHVQPDWDFTRVGTQSEYFEVKGRLRYEDKVIEQRHLVQRAAGGSGGGDVLVLQQSRFSGLDRAADGATPP